jgi:hypothetical protein
MPVQAINGRCLKCGYRLAGFVFWENVSILRDLPEELISIILSPKRCGKTLAVRLIGDEISVLRAGILLTY